MKLFNLRKFLEIESEQYTRLDFILVLFMILVSKSVYYETYGTNILLIPLMIILFYYVYRQEVTINYKLIFYSLFFMFLVLINPGTNLVSSAVLAGRFLVGILFVSLVPFNRFSYAFIDVLKYLSFFSLLYLPVIALQISSFLPDFLAIDGRELKNYIFFAVLDEYFIQGILRNAGLWWESGAYQVFINLAFIFAIINNTLTVRIYLLFAITIFTTHSTTGFIVFSLLSSIYFSKKLQTKKFFIYLGILGGIMIYVLLYILPGVLNKLLYSSEESASFLSRYTDVQISIAMFKENILIGYGYANEYFQESFIALQIIQKNFIPGAAPSGADGITMLIAQGGILMIFFLKPFLWPKYMMKLKIIEKVIIAISLLFLFNTENFIFILIFTILTFYGLQSKNKFYYQSSDKCTFAKGYGL